MTRKNVNKEDREFLEKNVWKRGRVRRKPIMDIILGWCAENDLTLAEVCNLAGIDDSTLSRRKMDFAMSFENADKLLTVIDCHILWHSPLLVEDYMNVHLPEPPRVGEVRKCSSCPDMIVIAENLFVTCEECRRERTESKRRSRERMKVGG